MNTFDSNIIEFLNRAAQHSHLLDESVASLDSDVFKGGAVLAIVWWAWFLDEGPDAQRRRSTILSMLGAAIFAVLVARALAHILPFRTRPLYTTELHFVPPFGTDTLTLQKWSSFPSDHAVVFFALATGIWVANRRLGLLAYLWAVFVICLPRVYLGIHWPTDILAGAAIGVSIGWLGTRAPVRRAIGLPVLALKDRYTGPFYAALFLVSFEIAVLGEDVRNIGSRLHDVVS